MDQDNGNNGNMNDLNNPSHSLPSVDEIKSSVAIESGGVNNISRSSKSSSSSVRPPPAAFFRAEKSSSNHYQRDKRQTDEKDGCGFDFGCNIPSILCVIFLLIIGIAIGLSVGLTKDNRKNTISTDSSSSSGGGGNIPAPTAISVTATYSPTLESKGNSAKTDIDTIRYEASLNYLKSILVNPETLSNETTPQAKALEWIVMEDDYFMLQQQNDADNSNTNNYIPLYPDTTSDVAVEFVQRYVMALFYYSTNGPNWDDDLSFLSPVHVCGWNSGESIKTNLVNAPSNNGGFGVLCYDYDDGEVNNSGGDINKKRISEINIFHNNLDGLLPEDLSLLSSLVIINIQDDFVHGTIPPQYYQSLTNLKKLVFYSNLLTGSISSDVSNMKELTTLDVSYNDMEGPIQTSIGLLTSLEILDLSHNRFDGSIPKELSKLSYLRALELNNNNIEQSEFPIWINGSNFPNLADLRLSNNNMTGSLPSGASTLQNLQYLYLDNNEFVGPIAVLNELEKLEVVVLSNNEFNQNIENEFFDNPTAHKDLAILDLSDNRFVGEFPGHLFQMESLSVLDLSNNLLGGNIFEVIPEIKEVNTELEYLSLFNNKFQETIPESISNLQALTHLDLSINDLSGLIPTEIGLMTRLKYLYLSQNDFHPAAAIPEFMQNLSSLEELSLSGTSRTGTVPTWIGSFKNMTLLDLDDNLLEDDIPEEIGLLSNLEFLLLSQNNFTGIIPRSIGQLDKLRVLLIHDNNILDTAADFLCDSTIPQKTKTGLRHFLADCDSLHPEDGYVCPCCTACCATEDVDCNSDRIISNLNGEYNNDYGRVDWNFGWEIAFNESEIFDTTGEFRTDD